MTDSIAVVVIMIEIGSRTMPQLSSLQYCLLTIWKLTAASTIVHINLKLIKVSDSLCDCLNFSGITAFIITIVTKQLAMAIIVGSFIQMNSQLDL